MTLKQKILAVTLFILLLAGILSFMYFAREEDRTFTTFIGGEPDMLMDVDYDSVHFVGDIKFSGSEKVWLVGQYTNGEIKTDDIESFELSRGSNSVSVNVENFEDSLTIEEGDFLIVEGRYDPNRGFDFFVRDMEKIDEKSYNQIGNKIYPAVEVEIMDRELSIRDGCEKAIIDVRVKNVGNFDIEYGKLESEYVFMTVIDGDIYSIFPQKDLGFVNFGTLEKGEEEVLPFILGKEPNVFCENETLDTTLRIDFGNIRTGDKGMPVGVKYDFANVFESNEIDVRVSNCDCD